MKFDLDGHKLGLHPDKVIAWQEFQRPFYPLTVEVSLTSHCNQACSFCAYDYQEKHHSMSKEEVMHVCEQIAIQTPSIVFSGEGEPTLSPSLSLAADSLKKKNRHLGIMTNGVNDNIINQVSRASWIRFSINGFTEDTYEKVHGKNHCKQVYKNLKDTVVRRNILHSPCTIGVQFMLVDENGSDLMPLAHHCRDTGLDYFVVKPISCHPQSENAENSPDLDYSLSLKLQALCTSDFYATYRTNAFDKDAKPYKSCLAAPWFHLITSDMKVWPCAQWVGLDDYCLGSLKYQTWPEVLMSDRHQQIMTALRTEIDVSTCRHPCRLDAANRYLHQLTHRGPHDFFV